METPTIKPFTESAQCAKCGAGDNTSVPMMGMTGVHSRYCPGGQEPEVEPDKNPIEALLTLIPAFSNPLAPRKSRINICAGIGEEHLHKTCSRCGFEWLTRVMAS